MAVSKGYLFCVLAVIIQANIGCDAFVPILGRSPSPRWNAFDDIWQVDPFKILETNPLSTPGDDIGHVSLTRVDWKETPEAHIIKIDVPGIKKEDIKMEVKDNVLTVSGESRREEKKESDQWHRVERVEGKFIRQFRLADGDMEGIKARLENGVLNVNVPKLPSKGGEAKPIIPITVAEEPCVDGGDKSCKAQV